MTLPPQVDKVRKTLDALAKRTYRDPRVVLPSNEWSYVFGFTKMGKTVFWGPMWPDEAEKELSRLADGEVFNFKTRSLSKATQELKAELLKRGVDPDEALKRVSHKRL